MKYTFDVAISFAGENRDFARAVAVGLKEKNVEVFFDEFYESHTWGENLPDLFKEVFGNHSQYCIMVLSDHYIEKEWPIVESKHAVARFIKSRSKSYILPVHLDGFDGAVPGLPDTLQYISAKSAEPEKVISAFLEKRKGNLMSSLFKNPLPSLAENKIADKPLKKTGLPIPSLGKETCGQDESSSPVKEHRPPNQKPELNEEKKHSPSTQGIQIKPQAPTEIVDREIEKKVEILRRSRFYKEFKAVRFSSNLAKKLVEGNLSGGSDIARSRALAWCARILSSASGELPDEAEKYLIIAKDLKPCEETAIAQAFISSRKGDKEAALNILDEIDSPAARSAALVIVAHSESSKEAVSWFEKSHLTVTDLDSEGKCFLLACRLDLADWNEARECLAALTDEDMNDMSALHHLKAITHLMSVVPEEFRSTLSRRPPFEVAEFILASNMSALRQRREAYKHFVKASDAARKLDCSDAAKTNEEYAFWLGLSDPEKSDEAKKQLEHRFLHPETVLHLVRLAVRFQINLDFQAIEREIERQIADGNIPHDAARARFALVFTKETFGEVADYIERYQDELSLCSNKKSVQILRIRTLCEAGRIEEAKKCLSILKEELSETEYEDLRGTIAEAKKNDPLKTLKKHFGETNDLNELLILIDKLREEERWEDICEYARILFEKTGSVSDAEKLVKAWEKTRRFEQIVEFMRANTDLVEQSYYLQLLYCSALYHEGELLEARSGLKQMDHDLSDENYRNLRMRIAASLGDWGDLSTIVVNELLEKDKRSARDLISIAEIAMRLNLQRAKDLTIAATKKDDADAAVLGFAYTLATEAGWDDVVEIQEWLEKAVELSGEDGPIQMLSFKDILNRKSEWVQRESEIWRRLVRGEVSMHLAAQFLNRSLVDLILLPALANRQETDLRRKRPIPAYNGNRPPARINTDGTLGIDATALLTLNFLGLLEKTLDAFSAVCIPHSTLEWLVEEKRRKFLQPGRVKDARRVRDLLATGMLEKFAESSVSDGTLSLQVGDDLATLIAAAENTEDNGGAQRVVVRSSPVYLASSLTGEEADLTAHARVLVSCRSVVGKLRGEGHITAEEENKAYAYLRLCENPWPDQPEIESGAILYLDDLSVTYFLHLGIIEKLKPAGFRPVILPRTVSETDALLSHKDISDEIDSAIENIRAALNSRIESGKIKVARQIEETKLAHYSLYGSLATGAYALAGYCDAVVADDRFVNGNHDIGFDDDKALTFSTLDVLDTLLSSGSITQETWRECRTRLRRAGYCFVSIDSEELEFHLNASKLKDGNVAETAELRAVRENILHVQTSDWLQFPKEWLWAYMSLTAFARAIKSFWTADADFADAEVRSDWIADRTNVKGWLQSVYHKNRDDVSSVGDGFEVLLMTVLLPPSADARPREAEKQYWNWLEDRILVPVKEQYPDLYSSVAQWYKKEISRYAEKYLDKVFEKTGGRYDKTELAKEALDVVPPLLRNTLLSDPAFCEEYKLEAGPAIFFENPKVAVPRSDLFRAIQKTLSGTRTEEVTDTDGREWKLENKGREDRPPSLVLSRGEIQFPVSPSFISLSPDAKTRLRFLEESASDINLPGDAEDTWRDVLAKRPLKNDEVEAFHKDLLHTPVDMVLSISDGISGKDVSFTVPSSRKYFDRLVGEYDGSDSIQDYATGGAGTLFERLSNWKPYEGFLFSLFLSSHSALTAEIRTDQLDNDDLARAYGLLERHGDRISQLGAIEIGFRILPSNPEVEPFLVRLVKQIRNDDAIGTTSDFKLFSALFVVADGQLSRIRLLSSKPPFYRRLTALTQAALIHRQLAPSIDGDSFHKWAFGNRGGEHVLQSLVDMRLEPHWSPLLGTPGQFRLSFLGRIVTAAKEHERNIRTEELRELVLGDRPESVLSAAHPFLSYFPGPLDGTRGPSRDLPDDRTEAIRIQTGAKAVTPSSFIALVNSARLFRLDSGHAELAAEALRACRHQISGIENQTLLSLTLSGLATVAAVARSHALADELRTVVRRYRRDVQYPVAVEEETVLCLAAAASRERLEDWTEFVGDWITEMVSVRELKNTEIQTLDSQLQYLCHAVPDLWKTCDRALAVLAAIDKS